MTILRILLTEAIPAQDTPLDWLLLEAGQLQAQGRCVLAEMPLAAQCEAVAPAAMVLLTQVKLPVQTGEKARRLLPFALEDQLANDSDANHFALGAPLADGMVAVAVVNKHWLRGCLALLADRAIRHLYPETLLLPLPENGWAVAWAGQQGVVRAGDYAGQFLEGDGVPFALSCLLKNVQPKQLCWYGTRPDWASSLDITMINDSNWQPDSAPLDLLQGEFAPRQFAWQGWGKFMPLLWLGGAMLLLQLMGTGVEVWRLSREQRQLQTQMETHFRAAFPEATVVIDPVLQMERQRTTLRRAAGIAESNDFLLLLGKLTPLLAGHQAKKITYENQSLKLDILFANTSEITALRARLLSSTLKNELVAEGTSVQLKVWE